MIRADPSASLIWSKTRSDRSIRASKTGLSDPPYILDVIQRTATSPVVHIIRSQQTFSTLEDLIDAYIAGVETLIGGPGKYEAHIENQNIAERLAIARELKEAAK